MSDYIIGERVIICKDDFAYISHPSITKLANGEWLAAFNHSRRRQPNLHPPSDPLFRTLLARSKDNGETWEAPYFAPGFDWSGTECPGIAQASDGTVILTEFRFAWYSLAEARKRKQKGEAIALNLPKRGWTEKFSERDWDDSRFTWARGHHGVYAHLSDDNGKGFTHTVKIDTGSYLDGYSRTGVIELRDGRIAYALTEHQPTPNPSSPRYTYLVFSEAGGRTWGDPFKAVGDSKRLFSEPDIAEVADGEIYCILRESRKRGFLYGCRSLDGGKTWNQPEPTSLYGHPGHLLVLSDGRLLCTYGCREAPFGIRACLSDDGGRNWSDEEIIIRDDLPNADLGYPTTIEYEPGQLFCCYYGQEPDGVTCVQGTYLEVY